MSSDKSNSFECIWNVFDKFLAGYSLSYLIDGEDSVSFENGEKTKNKVKQNQGYLRKRMWLSASKPNL